MVMKGHSEGPAGVCGSKRGIRSGSVMAWTSSVVSCDDGIGEDYSLHSCACVIVVPPIHSIYHIFKLLRPAGGATDHFRVWKTTPQFCVNFPKSPHLVSHKQSSRHTHAHIHTNLHSRHTVHTAHTRGVSLHVRGAAARPGPVRSCDVTQHATRTPRLSHRTRTASQDNSNHHWITIHLPNATRASLARTCLGAPQR